MNNMELAEKEYREVTEWVLSEEEKVMHRLKSENKYLGGLDGQEEEFAYIYAERNKRIKEIREKYGLCS
ncbi:MAG: hypothetical protein J6C19_14395 [Lachnospiraceae bacterium]|nr:hypothetical protein [Lachnospiraceae bacterium]MBO5146692.1 hypothetical protein [Lachnospiraceae bacterium]